MTESHTCNSARDNATAHIGAVRALELSDVGHVHPVEVAGIGAALAQAEATLYVGDQLAALVEALAEPRATGRRLGAAIKAGRRVALELEAAAAQAAGGGLGDDRQHYQRPRSHDHDYDGGACREVLVDGHPVGECLR